MPFLKSNNVAIFAALIIVAIGISYGLISSESTKPTLKQSGLLNVYVVGAKTTELNPPQLPDISRYTTEEIIKLLPKSFSDTPEQPSVDLVANSTLGSKNKKEDKEQQADLETVNTKEEDIQISTMTEHPELSEFLEDNAPRRLRLLQRRVFPKAIVIKAGDYTLDGVYEYLQRRYPDNKYLLKKDKIYSLRMPLLVGQNASLSILGEQVKELRMSQEQNAFLANGGLTFIISTKVSGWNEGAQSYSIFKDKHDFRPFIVSWGGAKLYIANSKILDLGYSSGKSYGVSYSTCTDCLKKQPDLSPPTGAVVDSYFSGMYYGFYSYEATDVAIVGNTYANNIIYAIDPHDRSRRLIIARNETFGSKKKHGIIVSREVNDSWIFDNHSHHNHGSGIMLDRSSINNIVANNLSEHNEQDGLTFFESQNNITWGNVFLNNKRNGIRIRNSWNIKIINDSIIGNKGAAIDIYSANIEAWESRDFELDPYTQRADAFITEVAIKSDLAPAFKIGPIEDLTLSKIFITPAFSPIFVGGDNNNNLGLISLLRKEDWILKITPEKLEGGKTKLVTKLKPVE